MGFFFQNRMCLCSNLGHVPHRVDPLGSADRPCSPHLCLCQSHGDALLLCVWFDWSGLVNGGPCIPDYAQVWSYREVLRDSPLAIPVLEGLRFVVDFFLIYFPSESTIIIMLSFFPAGLSCHKRNSVWFYCLLCDLQQAPREVIYLIHPFCVCPFHFCDLCHMWNKMVFFLLCGEKNKFVNYIMGIL